MNSPYHTADLRQRLADYSAVLVLTRAAAENVDLSVAQLGGIVAAFLPTMEPDRLRAWSDMDMAQAVRTIKIDLLRHEIARVEALLGPPQGRRKARRGGQAAGTRRSEPESGPARTQRKLSEREINSLDEEISRSVVANFFKFMTISALDPSWFTPYLTEIAVF